MVTNDNKIIITLEDVILIYLKSWIILGFLFSALTFCLKPDLL